MVGIYGDRHLMRAEGAFDLQAIDHLRPGPALGRLENDHRPARAHEVAVGTGVVLDMPDFFHRLVECRSHGLVHQRGILALDEVRRPAAAAEKLFQFLRFDARENGRVGNLVAVEMQDRQHRAVAGRVQELVGMPGGGQRPGFRLAVADDAGDDQIGIVEHRPEGMAERIAQLAPLVDRARTFRRGVAGNAAGKGKLLEELLQSGLVLADVGINLAVGPLQIGVGDHCRPAVPGAGNIDHVEIVFLDDPVQVYVNEVLPGGRAPVPQQHMLHIRQRQRPPQQRIVVEINLPDREIVGGAPVGVDLAEQLRGEGFGLHGLFFLRSFVSRSRKALSMTKTELKLIRATQGLQGPPGVRFFLANRCAAEFKQVAAVSFFAAIYLFQRQTGQLS